jgi:hypothetical protein
MAITLSVFLTDAEQAKLSEIAEALAPGASPAQIKAWAEREAKNGLRNTIQRIYFDHQNKMLDEAWPEPQPTPPEVP